jgi:hypothetical protein
MDWDNRFSRCTQNLIVNTRTMFGGIFIEASQQPNLIDQNIVWGSAGHGIYEHDCFGQIFAHNLLARNSGSGFHLHGRITDRKIAGQEPRYGKHTVKNNLLSANKQPVLYGGEPSEHSGNIEEGITAELNRASWKLTLSIEPAPADVSSLSWLTRDYFDAPRQADRSAPGPFRQISPTPQQLVVWPRP